jgi:hypothetical protein
MYETSHNMTVFHAVLKAHGLVLRKSFWRMKRSAQYNIECNKRADRILQLARQKWRVLLGLKRRACTNTSQ